jgi:hypothetical protein
MEIQFHGRYDKRMFLQGLALLDRTRPVYRILRWLALGLGLAVIGLSLYDWIRTGDFDAGRTYRSAFTVLLLGYYFVAPHVTRWATVSRQFKDAPSRTMQGRVDHAAITITAANGRTAVFAWEKFFRRGIREPLLALMTLDGSMALFHRSFFQSESDWSRFRQLVDKHVIEPR